MVTSASMVCGSLVAVLTVAVVKLRREIEHLQEMRQSERQGRIRAERKIEEALDWSKIQESSGTSHDGYSLQVHAIGRVSSVFEKRLGTPRQPGLVQSAVSTIELHPALVQSVDSLEKFSHIWVLFVFHGNTNMSKRLSSERPFDGLKQLVVPPKANGAKVGLLACRTPHRPNPIGLSLCKLVSVKGRTIAVSGLDCLHGTPVIDIKPYLPIIECVPDAIVPDWIYQGVDEDRRIVEISWDVCSCDDAVKASLDAQFVNLIEETLSRDIRSRNQIRLATEMESDWVGELRLKNRLIRYSVDKERRSVQIRSVSSY